MSKTQNIKELELLMPTLPEDVISAFMTLAKVNRSPLVTKFNFTAEQLAELTLSRDDLRAGRTVSLDEVDAELTHVLTD